MQEEGMKSALQVRIEQAIAFGRSVDWILRHLPATVADIDTAMRTLDAAVKDDPYVQGYDRTGPRINYCRRRLHELTPANTYRSPSRGHRECAACRSERQRRRRVRKAANDD